MKKVIFLLLIILSTLFIPIYINKYVYANGEYWLNGYQYRKSLLIINATGSETDYPINITTFYGSGSDSYNNVYLDSKCQTDFDDINFTKSDGNTTLDYWIEPELLFDSDNATFWIEIQDNLSSNNVTIYLYYGNNTISTFSNIFNTFSFADDFDNNSLGSAWNLISGTPSFSGGIITVNADNIETQNMVIVNHRFRSYARWTGTLTNDGQFGINNATNLERILFWIYSNVPTARYNVRDNTQSSQDYTPNSTWLVHQYLWIASSYVNFSLNDISQFNTSNNIPDLAMCIRMISLNNNPSLEVDWIFVAKYVYPEPYAYEWGTEEEIPDYPFYTVFGSTSTLANITTIFYCNWTTDHSTLSSYIFGSNISGSFVNETVQFFYPQETLIESSITTGTHYTCYLWENHPSASGNWSGKGETILQNNIGSYNISKFSVRLKKIGNPNCNISAGIYNVIGTTPNSYLTTDFSPYENSTTIINSTSLTTSFVWYNFSFSESFTMDYLDYHGFAIFTLDKVSLDINNAVIIEESLITESNPYIYGNEVYYDYSTWNSTGVSADIEFKLYGIETNNGTWSNVTKTLPSTTGTVIAYQFWANNSYNNWNTTGIQYLTLTGINLTFFHNDKGFIYASLNSVDSFEKLNNNTVYSYCNGSNLHIIASVKNASYIFNYIAYNDTYNIVSTEYNYTIKINLSKESKPYFIVFEDLPSYSESIIDQFWYNSTEANTAYAIWKLYPSEESGRSAVGSTFTVNGTYRIMRTSFWIYSVIGNPNGSVVACIYTINGTSGVNGTPYGYIPENVIPLATSEETAIANLTGTAIKIDFIFNSSEQVILEENDYCVALLCINVSDIDTSNYFAVRGYNNAPYGIDDGNYFSYWGQNGYWTYDTPRDTYFVVYGSHISIIEEGGEDYFYAGLIFAVILCCAVGIIFINERRKK